METKSWWKKLKNNPFAQIGATVLIVFYVVAIFADFVAPYNPIVGQPNGSLLPPTRIYLRAQGEQGTRQFLGPHVYPTIQGPLDIETGNRNLVVDFDRPSPIRLFVKGDEYRLFELSIPYFTKISFTEPMELDEFQLFTGIPMSRHLFGPVGSAAPAPVDADVEAAEGTDAAANESDILAAVPEESSGEELTAVQTTPAYINLLGTDNAARDIFSRLAFGGRISLSIGLVGTLISFPLGLLIGGISGYFGGLVDSVLMRVVEVIMIFPTFYLLVSLGAVLPANFGNAERFLFIVFITSFIGWTGLARIIRGEVLSLKQRNFVQASKSMGGRSLHIITRHILPQTATYVIISATLAIPSYIVYEAVLSLVGLGIQEPDPSWGNMLSAGTNASVLVLNPWLVWPPAALIMTTVLCFNLLGDGLRDALDPRSLEEQ
ncbi:MAG: ABC transporter permease [Cyanobacteria bacterium P01_F01_bin.53]